MSTSFRTVTSTAPTSRSAGRNRIFRFVLLVLVLSCGALLELRQLQSLENPISYLDLSLGNWIVAHRAIPQSGVLSRLSDQSWADPAWFSQFAYGMLYKVVGIRAIPLHTMFLRLVFALAMFGTGGGFAGRFWRGAALALGAQIAVSPTVAQDGLLSGVLLAVELMLLREAQERRSAKWLYGLPLLIALWANLDWRFVIGVEVVVLFVIAHLIERLSWRSASREINPLTPALVLLVPLSVLASVVSPCGVAGYRVAWERWLGAGLVDWYGSGSTFFPEWLLSMSFHSAAHFVLAVTGMLAFFQLGRNGMKPYFLLAVLMTVTALSFSYQSEAWAVVSVAVAVLGGGLEGRKLEIQVASLSFGVSLALVLLCIGRLPEGPQFTAVADKTYPLAACAYIQANRLPGPIYNEMEWGDFLTWYMPQYQVSNDSRTELYSSRFKTAMAITRGQIRPIEDSMFAESNIVILRADSALIKGAEVYPDPKMIFDYGLPGFRQVYRDDRAVVLQRLP